MLTAYNSHTLEAAIVSDDLAAAMISLGSVEGFNTFTRKLPSGAWLLPASRWHGKLNSKWILKMSFGDLEVVELGTRWELRRKMLLLKRAGVQCWNEKKKGVVVLCNDRDSI